MVTDLGKGQLETCEGLEGDRRGWGGPGRSQGSGRRVGFREVGRYRDMERDREVRRNE